MVILTDPEDMDVDIYGAFHETQWKLRSIYLKSLDFYTYLEFEGTSTNIRGSMLPE